MNCFEATPNDGHTGEFKLCEKCEAEAREVYDRVANKITPIMLDMNPSHHVMHRVIEMLRNTLKDDRGRIRYPVTPPPDLNQR